MLDNSRTVAKISAFLGLIYVGLRNGSTAGMAALQTVILIVYWATQVSADTVRPTMGLKLKFR